MILKFKAYNEVSGTELVGKIGPGYGDVDPKNNTISRMHTDIFSSDGELLSWDQYQEYINDFLKNGGIINQLTGNIENDVFYIKNFIENK